MSLTNEQWDKIVAYWDTREFDADGEVIDEEFFLEDEEDSVDLTGIVDIVDREIAWFRYREREGF